MAALLKKRALAEYSQVIQEEPPKAPKRLRLTKRASSSANVDFDLLKSAADSDVIQLLVQLSENLPTEPENGLQAYKILLERFQTEKESAVRSKIVSIVCLLLQNSLVDRSTVMDDMVPLLKNETSHKVISQFMKTLFELGKLTGEGRNQQKILQLAKQYINDSSHVVKAHCLTVISEFTSVDGQLETSQVNLRILCDYSRNSDCRVRTTALQCLLHLQERGLQLDVNMYEEICNALSDDYEGVRIEAMKIIQVLCHSYPEHAISVGNSQEKIRLADDAFSRICNMMNDLSLKVRIEAAVLLGKMKEVGLQFLEQTLDKKLMSNLRKKLSAHERQKENFESGEWATGQKWADDAPRELVDTESINLMRSGACGAFVHGLEDEFLDVRSATLDSLCTLALEYPSFARTSLDFLVDMFNDEIEEVRLKAIRCLTRLSRHVMLREDQLETVLALLEDFSMDIREALQEMLGTCCLTTKTGLRSCIDNLLENLKRYPQDKKNIWRCFQHLGAKHPYLTLPLVPELLGIHPFFDMPEADIEDLNYISILILVFNAAAHCPPMMPLFEDHTLRHYGYLRDTQPNLVPLLKLPNEQNTMVMPVSSLEQSKAFFHQVLDRVSSCEHRNVETRQQLLSYAISDLQKLAEIEPEISAVANYACYYIQCQLLFSKILANKNWSNPSVLSSLQGSSLKTSLEQLLHLSFCLNHQFLGLSLEEKLFVKQLRVWVLAFHLVVVICKSNASALGLCDIFLEQVDSLQRYIEENNLQPDHFTAAMIRELNALEEPKPGTVSRILQPLLQSNPCLSLKMEVSSTTCDLERVKQASAVICEPSGESDNPSKFTAGLVLAVTLDVQLENIEDPKSVRIKVKYPDQQTQYILPPLADFRQQGTHQYRLYSSVLLSHSVWSEACHVEISIVLGFADAEGLSGMRSLQKSPLGLSQESHCIDLSKPVRVYISPKPARKGI